MSETERLTEEDLSILVEDLFGPDAAEQYRAALRRSANDNGFVPEVIEEPKE